MATTRDELFESLEGIRDRGYALDSEERAKDLQCIAAPCDSPFLAIRPTLTVLGRI